LGEDTFPLRYRGSRDPKQLTALFRACFRIAKQAGVPLVVENVRGAQPWVGKAKANYGSFFLWGDVPDGQLGKYVKRGGFSWSDYGKEDYVPTAFNGSVGRKFNQDGTEHGQKVMGMNPDGRRTDVGKGARFTSTDCGVEALYADRDSQGIKQPGSGHVWYRTGNGALPSKSPRRKAAAAQIAKIPFPLASAIARHFYPR
jgi:hypothetical protein